MIDASVVVAGLVDSGVDGLWADEILTRESLAAPQLLMVEIANVLRRAALTRKISEDAASLAYAELLNLRVELFPYDLVADRVWELRKTVTPYDAWYVALAETLGAPLATLDHKLARSSGPRCKFKVPLRRAK